MKNKKFTTKGGIIVERRVSDADYERGVEPVCEQLNNHRGVVLSSGFEFPGRYTCFDWGFTNPPLQVETRGRDFTITALNARGGIILGAVAQHFSNDRALSIDYISDREIRGHVLESDGVQDEAKRSQQRTIFTMLRSFIALFSSDADPVLGLYGAFSYDLGFQFEPINLRAPRPDDHRDLVLYLPDQILAIDHVARRADLVEYDFTIGDETTASLPHDNLPAPICVPKNDVTTGSDHAPGTYVAGVERAREAFKKGDLFEAVLSQTFSETFSTKPSILFERLRKKNPAPYGAFMNLDKGEALVAASPEMFVRVEGARIETCPISGTIARGRDAIEDAQNIQKLLNSEKDLSELTMCTDVDRNDKSRICTPGSVKVIGRRQLELYSSLIHTVDHVEGQLADGYDALDAFLTHMWAVTVTGAPKPWAMQFIEDNETTPRRWYGGAIGRVTFDGNMNTGLTLRTIRLANGVAEVRAGATLLFDSDPQAEDDECALKASALLAVLRDRGDKKPASQSALPQSKKRILVVDHQDSFVHTIASYLREFGCDVIVQRADYARKTLAQDNSFDLLVLSPGPGIPADFDVSATLGEAVKNNIAVFGVCLGLQGMVEYEGGVLSLLDYPMHGKPSCVQNLGGALMKDIPQEFTVARYHSLYAPQSELPSCFHVSATSDDGVVMAIEHKTRPWTAVQFHPESILTSVHDVARPLLYNALMHGDDRS